MSEGDWYTSSEESPFVHTCNNWLWGQGAILRVTMLTEHSHEGVLERKRKET